MDQGLTAPAMIDAEELVRTYTVEQLAETAEQYFASVHDWTYHMSKPLGSVLEAPVMLAHFAAMLSVLQLSPDMDVLDFGAGSCWTSRSLAQLGCHVTACDVSTTALAMGERLLDLQPVLGPGTLGFLRFDGHRLEVADESVDRVSCMDAFHHVPNWETVLAEFHRILRPGGRVVLAEGGPDHSRTAQAQEEMRNHLVVERDLVVEDFAHVAAAAGFAETLVGLYAGVPGLIPAGSFTAELELGEAARTITQSFLQNHRLVVLRKAGQSRSDSRGVDGLLADIAVDHLGGRRFRARLENRGRATWLPSGRGVGSVNLGVQLVAADGRMANLDFHREAPPYPRGTGLESGGVLEFDFELPEPSIDGYVLAFDLVSEGVAWFQPIGATPGLRLGPFRRGSS